MNFLAHLFLSGKNPQVRLGNFGGDWFKGKLDPTLPLDLQKGVQLHRAIDQFADQHPINKQLYVELKPILGRYANPVIDVLHDHFLSIHFEAFINLSLEEFTNQCIADLREQALHLPAPLPERIGQMFQVNWLAKYGSEEGMMRSFANLSKRARFENKMQHSWQLIQPHYSDLNFGFLAFFPDMLRFSAATKRQLGV